MFYLVIVFCWLSSSGHPASGIHIRKPSCLKKYEFSDHPWAAQVRVFPGFEGLNVGWDKHTYIHTYIHRRKVLFWVSLHNSSTPRSQSFESKLGQVSSEISLTTSPARVRGFAMPLQPQWWSSGGLRIGCDFGKSWAQEREFWTTRRPRATLQWEESVGRKHWRPCSPLGLGRRRVSTASSPKKYLHRKAPGQRLVSSTHSLWYIQRLHLNKLL